MNESVGRQRVNGEATAKKESCQRGLLEDLEPGRKPTAACPYQASDSYLCHRVSAAEGEQNTTTNKVRKVDPASGLSCLDAAGYETHHPQQHPGAPPWSPPRT